MALSYVPSKATKTLIKKSKTSDLSFCPIRYNGSIFSIITNRMVQGQVGGIRLAGLLSQVLLRN